jgi:hypothetical protein
VLSENTEGIGKKGRFGSWENFIIQNQ